MSGVSRRAWLTAAAGMALGEMGAEAQLSDRMAEVPAGPIPKDGAAAGRFAGKSWRIQQMVDEDDAAAVMTDIQFASPERGIAVGSLVRKGREENQGWVTRDGGAKWTVVKLKDFPVSVNMLDESRIFIVGRDALWYSEEGGLVWAKRKLPKLDRAARRMGMFVNRVSFADEKRGWAFGGGKIFYVTNDGGLTWAPVPESEALGLKSENSIWMWMTWVTAKSGMIIGHSASAPKDASRFPDWMVPERAVRTRLTPTTTMVAETHDGGLKWKTSVASTFGQATRMRSLGSRGLSLFHYGDGLEFPAEVYSLDMVTGKNAALFRRKDMFVQDAVPLNNGGALVVAVEPPGRLRNSPIPGKVRVFVTPDGGAWSEMKVDYRVVGRRATLARFDDNSIWMCTDEGMILRMV